MNMIKTFCIEKDQKPTKEQLQEIEEAAKKPIVFDEDSPEMSQAMYKAMERKCAQRNRRIAEQMDYVKQITEIVRLLPSSEQRLAYELVKRIALAWDPDYVKLTEDEARKLKEAELDREGITLEEYMQDNAGRRE